MLQCQDDSEEIKGPPPEFAWFGTAGVLYCAHESPAALSGTQFPKPGAAHHNTGLMRESA
jgi:hypothetical protein